jgi:hypothetical protein
MADTEISNDATDQIAALLNDEPETDEKSDDSADLGQDESETAEGKTGGEEDKGDQEAEDEVTWAKVLGVDDSTVELDEEGNLKGLKVKVDGEESTIPVKDLIAGYQLNKHVTQKSMALSEEKKAFEQLKNQASQTYVEKLETVDKLTGLIQQSLSKDFQSIDWPKLRAENPAEYAASLADFQTRQGQLQSLMSAISEERNEIQSKSQQEFQQNYQRHLENQFKRVLENNPTWSDPVKMQSDVQKMSQFVQSSYGITQEEFGLLNDARHIEILKDAMAYRQGKEVVQKKIVNKPVFQKSNTNSKPKGKLDKLISASKSAKGPAQRDLQTAAVVELLMNGN